MSRRILHIIESVGRTGGVTQLLILARGLSKLGLDLHVAALESGGALLADFAAVELPIVELGRRWPNDPIAYLRLHRLVTRLRPDVIHTWDAASGIYGSVASRAAGRPRLILGWHRIDPWQDKPARFIQRRLAQPAVRFVTSSTWIRDWYAKQGLPPNRYDVIPPGVPAPPTSDVPREKLLGELRLPANARLIGVVGRLVPEKGVKDLIWAADLLRVLHDNLRLLIIGDGPMRPQLEQYARLASDLDHIRFLGERADLWRIMPHLDVLWNASEPRGHSLAILEAMAAGVPVLASDTPCNRELVVENETGYLIPLRERAGRATRARHTDQIFANGELAVRLAANSRQRVAKHNCDERMVQQYVDAYTTSSDR